MPRIRRRHAIASTAVPSAPYDRPSIVDILEPGYGPLLDRLVEVLDADDRVRAIWLSGSVARGTADAVSDLDLLLAIDDGRFDEFAAEWKQWLAAVTPTVIARALPFLPGSLYCVTPDRLRLDIVSERVSALTNSMLRIRTAVLDKDGLGLLVPPASPGPGPSTARVAQLIEEFYRDYGMFPVGTVRRDWLLGLEAIHLIRTLLYQLFVESNAPLPAMGVKQWSAKLTPAQIAVLEALPTGRAERDAVIRAHEAVSVAFVTHARMIAADLGVAWPAELHRSTVAYLRGHGLPHLETVPFDKTGMNPAGMDPDGPNP